MATQKTQKQKLFNYLAKPGKRITAEQALNKFGVKNLRARIHELRSDLKWTIVSKPTTKNSAAVTYKVERVGQLA